MRSFRTDQEQNKRLVTIRIITNVNELRFGGKKRNNTIKLNVRDKDAAGKWKINFHSEYITYSPIFRVLNNLFITLRNIRENNRISEREP